MDEVARSTSCRAAIAHLRADRLEPCQKIFARCKQVLRQLTEMWSVLETLTPSEYMEFREILGPVVGLPVVAVPHDRIPAGQQERADAARVRARPGRAGARCSEVLEAPSLYDEVLRYLARHGHAVPAEHLERDWSQPHVFAPDLVPVFETIYEDTKAHWDAYHLCEDLVDLETQFQLWRFRHMRTVMRIIGFKRGTGGSSGVGFLQAGAGADLLPGTVRGPHGDRPAGPRAADCAECATAS